MPCAHPITINQKGTNYKVPCRQCMPCRIQYQEQLVFACSNELLYNYIKGYGATFNCLTYDDNHLPPLGSLRKKDFQLFIKRLRSNIKYKNPLRNFKYIACGEYGGQFGRAHYHFIIIGLTDIETKKYANQCWDKGLIDIQTLGTGGLRYVLKYCSKQIKGKIAEELYTNQGLEKPFLLRSIKMGYEWLNNNAEQITNNNFTYIKNGKYVPIPKYYKNILDKNKICDNLVIKQAIKKTADSLGLSIDKYSRYVSLAKEKMLIDASREAGEPIDDYEYIVDNALYNSSSLKNNVIDIIDPILF
jgi:hypothetical protein